MSADEPKAKRMSKTLSGHKCERVQVWVEVICECGWRSTMAGGPGARATGYAEWRQHRDHCARVNALMDEREARIDGLVRSAPRI